MAPPRPGSDPPPAAAPAAEQTMSFEAALARLERGDLALEAALAAFEEGVQLARRCASQLEDAERRIDVLLREGGGWVTRPLEAPEEAEGK